MLRCFASSVDYVDLYQCYRYDADTPLEETMQALVGAKWCGQERFAIWGFRSGQLSGSGAALAIPGVEKFASSQPQYLGYKLHRSPEDALIPLCSSNGISQIVWLPLAQGVLTGKYASGAVSSPADSRAANDAINGFINQAWLKPSELEAVQKLRPLAPASGL